MPKPPRPPQQTTYDEDHEAVLYDPSLPENRANRSMTLLELRNAILGGLVEGDNVTLTRDPATGTVTISVTPDEN